MHADIDYSLVDRAGTRPLGSGAAESGERRVALPKSVHEPALRTVRVARLHQLGVRPAHQRAGPTVD